MSLSENLRAIQDRIAGRAQLVAVSKNQPDYKIDDALYCGQRVFGENRVQEAKAHWQNRREAYDDLILHLIGPLQTNKARDAIAIFDYIQTLDRARLVDALAEEEGKQGRNLKYFIQVNTGAEKQKAGVDVEALPELLDYARLKNLDVIGLMCIPPQTDDPATHFRLLKKLAGENNLPELSMGMSGDYGAAIECGATYVRVGTALFGER